MNTISGFPYPPEIKTQNSLFNSLWTQRESLRIVQTIRTLSTCNYREI